ncbi:hypothetical protein EKK58_01580 [Candidatus Dependentiae bacterium]|nr:MAG: hypothetical protein EKK58_01580 [Candidatus Dependentiae bacterium]
MLLLYIASVLFTMGIQADTETEAIIPLKQENTLEIHTLPLVHDHKKSEEQEIPKNTISKVEKKTNTQDSKQKNIGQLKQVEKKSLKNDFKSESTTKSTSDDNGLLQNKNIIAKNKTDNKKIELQSLQKITIINSITPEKTAYAHWSGTYQPEFKVMVNGTQVENNTQKSIELHKNENTISITYHAQFPANHKSEGNIAIAINENTQKIVLDFDWNSEPRLQARQSP